MVPGTHWVHPLALATPFQPEAFWKGIPLRTDIRNVLVKVLQHGFQTDGVGILMPLVGGADSVGTWDMFAVRSVEQ
jgi:hypothetical protein